MPDTPEPKIGEGDTTSSPYIRTFAKDYQTLSGKLPDEKSSGKKSKAPKAQKVPKPKKEKPKKAEKPPKKVKEKRVKKEAVKTTLEEVTVPQPVAAVSIPAPIIPPEVAPSVSPIVVQPAAPPVRLPATPVAPAPPQRPSTASGSPSPLETYSTDFASHIDQTGASRFSVLAAEKDSQPKRAAKKPKRPSHAGRIIVILLILIIIGAGGGYVAYVVANTPVSLPVALGPTYLIPPTSTTELKGAGTSLLESLADTANQPAPANSIVAVYVEQSTTTPQGVVEAPASGGAFISALNLAAPSILIRNIDPSSMVGIVQADTQTAPFFVFRVTSYDRTYAGMLEWEPTMLQSLSPLYALYPNNVAENASSTDALDNGSEPQGQFTDELVENYSVRALKDFSGRTILVYGYVNQETLIIARDEMAFQLLADKLTSAPS